MSEVKLKDFIKYYVIIATKNKRVFVLALHENV